MDIASVYLNLVFLLGTEIEVEGYYFWQRLYCVKKDQQSLNIALPSYIRHQGLMNIGHALQQIDYWTKVTFQGYLKQNQRGEINLDRINSISYATSNVRYQACLVYDEDTIICEMQGDVIVNQVKLGLTRYSRHRSCLLVK